MKISTLLTLFPRLMPEALGMFTQSGSFEDALFNRGGSLWPEADVTLIGQGHLTLGMTEKEEKAGCRALMQTFGCSELEAARKVEQKLDRLRGLLTDEGTEAA